LAALSSQARFPAACFEENQLRFPVSGSWNLKGKGYKISVYYTYLVLYLLKNISPQTFFIQNNIKTVNERIKTVYS